MMLEAYLSRQDMALYYECGDFPFNFAFMAFEVGVAADEVKANIDEMMQFLPPGKTANWLVSRVITGCHAYGKSKCLSPIVCSQIFCLDPF
jgi:hypothetical protein